jgi:hypothetical protein
MTPKKVTDVEKPKRKIIMSTVKFLKSRQRQMTLDRFFSKKYPMMVVVVSVNHSLPLVDSRGDEKAHQKASFYGI